MMPDKEQPRDGILDTMAALSAQGESGRLDIFAGAIEGALLFRNGKLVDARLGDLTGFQAINALAAMRDARYQFDPSVVAPNFTSITSSERHVLKQFFGIETADSRDFPAPVIAYDNDETTVLQSDVTSAPAATLPAPYRARSRTPYLLALAISVLVIGLAAAAVFLRSRYRELSAPAPAAIKTETVSTPAPAETTADKEPAPAVRDLSGKWNVVNTIHTTSYKSFQNIQIGFAVSINQTGSTFTAQGEKISENGRSLPAGSRTPIQLQGTIDGDKIEATFFEQGAMRKSSGRFVWKIDRASGGLTGTFASTAAGTSGKSTARREL